MDRQQAFQQLKQPCVRLLHVTAHLSATPSARQHLVCALTDLLSTLQSVTTTPGLLDAKLAEYAFVPISQVLRASRQVPVRAMELCLQCISSLLCAGWGGGLEPALSGQLVILFTFLAKPSSAHNGLAATSEELQALALQCLAELFTEASHTRSGRSSLTSSANIPALGEAVLVILDSLTDSASNQIKLQSLVALNSLNSALDDDDALASFLPRMISSLTKVLTPSSSHRPLYRVVERGLQVFTAITTRLLSDRNTGNLPDEAPVSDGTSQAATVRSTPWLVATSAQLKIALANVFKLRYHDKLEVQRGLLNLCLCVIQDCRSSLSNCTGMAIETIVTLESHEAFQNEAFADFNQVLSSDQVLSDILKSSLHDWVVSLPRLMRSKDDQSRQRLIHQISVTLRHFEHESFTLSDDMSESLRDAASAIFENVKGFEEIVSDSSMDSSNTTVMLSSKNSTAFAPLRLRLKGQEDMMAEFRFLLTSISKSGSALSIAQGLKSSIEAGTVESRFASYWIVVSLLKDVASNFSILEDFIDLGNSNPHEDLLDDLYSLSISFLSGHDSLQDMPWQYHALALEVVALQAVRYRSGFRAELSEGLYPVLQYLASPNSALRAHASTCLNLIASTSEYANASELVISNVDYVVNAVSLKLAIGDVSPQAPQVLLMMMRLCGPRLLPYLDDLVTSIFEALERYHGYPKLAQLLFSVLKGITDEGAKVTELAIVQDKSEQDHSQDTAVREVADALRNLRTIDHNGWKHERKQEYTSFPRKPWQDDDTTVEDNSISPLPKPEEPGPPAPRVFDMLLRISELTQHYLGTNLPELKNSLLILLQTTIPALAKHEDSFLPLINTLWPVLLSRLEDSEAYVVCNCLKLIALMCENAGNFMRSRIEDAWESLLRVHRRTHQGSDDRRRANSPKVLISDSVQDIVNCMEKPVVKTTTTVTSHLATYIDAPTRMIRNSLVHLLCAIARHIALGEERFDDLLDLLCPTLSTDEVRQALEKRNPDAVWLRLYKSRKKAGIGNSSNRTSSSPLLSSKPACRPCWHFISA
ncbi:hypothetical protein ACN47E_007522 [Coniothyrium glycines]